MGCAKCSKGLKWGCGIAAILLVTILIVLIVLFLTIFKLKEPKITTQPVALENFHLIFFPALLLNLTLGVVVTVENRNYGSFKYKNGTAYVSYQGMLAAEAPLEDGKIPARGKQNISTSVTVFADKLISNSSFLGDVISSGVLNFSSTTTLHGKASILKYFKKKATCYNSCDISIFVLNQSINSTCKSKVEF